MIVIADSGSTKTDWCIGNSQTDYRIVQTPGINPFYLSTKEISRQITENLFPQLTEKDTVTELYFYGAGCTPEKACIVADALTECFPHAHVAVESDLSGAARALCGHTKGIACILGTGSNSCEYDGEKIVSNVSPLGYILGDEGSGAVLGKRLVGDCLKKQLPPARTLERELSSLRAVRDNYPKTLITLDDERPVDHEGIRQVYALDWLLDGNE